MPVTGFRCRGRNGDPMGRWYTSDHHFGHDRGSRACLGGGVQIVNTNVGLTWGFGKNVSLESVEFYVWKLH